MSQQDFLFELGTEELPPTALGTLSCALLSAIEQGLQAAELDFSGTVAYAAPRRLAVGVNDLQTQQADRQTENRGPAVAAARTSRRFRNSRKSPRAWKRRRGCSPSGPTRPERRTRTARSASAPRSWPTPVAARSRWSRSSTTPP